MTVIDSELEIAREIRREIIEFSNEEILPLMSLDKIETLKRNTRDAIKRKRIEEQERIEINKNKEKAFNIALKLFLIHDMRLKGSHSLEFIGIIFGVTKQQAHNINERAIAKLTTPKIGKPLKEYIDS